MSTKASLYLSKIREGVRLYEKETMTYLPNIWSRMHQRFGHLGSHTVATKRDHIPMVKSSDPVTHHQISSLHHYVATHPGTVAAAAGGALAAGMAAHHGLKALRKKHARKKYDLQGHIHQYKTDRHFIHHADHMSHSEKKTAKQHLYHQTKRAMIQHVLQHHPHLSTKKAMRIAHRALHG